MSVEKNQVIELLKKEYGDIPSIIEISVETIEMKLLADKSIKKYIKINFENEKYLEITEENEMYNSIIEIYKLDGWEIKGRLILD